jgi:glycogen debranching enzyme
MKLLRRTFLKLTSLGITAGMLESLHCAGSGFGRMLAVPVRQSGGSCEKDQPIRENGSKSTELISVLSGSTFVVSNRTGDIARRPAQPNGFFYKDTRHLSHWVLTVNDTVPEDLSTDTIEYYFVQFFLRLPTGWVGQDSSLSLMRKRFIGEGFIEKISIMNHGTEPTPLVLRLEAGADFADLFEVKDVITKKKGKYYREVRKGEVVLGYRRDDFVRETRISSSEPAEIDGQTFSFKVQLDPRSERKTRLQVQPVTSHLAPVPRRRGGLQAADPDHREGIMQWINNAPSVSGHPDLVRRTYDRSLLDLASLRFTRASCRAPQCPQRACLGSWPCSAGTV